MKVSVVIPAKDVSETLTALLDSLYSQKFKPYEVIIVYNNVIDNSIFSRYKDKVRFLRLKKLGVNHARNKGVEVAKGDIIAFTDSDCVADAKWIGSLLTEFKNFDVDAVAGVVKTYNREEFIARYVSNSLFRPTRFRERKILRNSMGIDIAVTSNLAVKRDVLLNLGGFDEEYYRYGCDDVDLITRLIENRYKVLLSPLPVIYHIERTKLSKVVKRFYEYGKGFSIYRFKHPSTLLSLTISMITYGVILTYLISAYLLLSGELVGLYLSMLHPAFLIVYHMALGLKERRLERAVYPFLDFTVSLSSLLGILIMDCKILTRKLAYRLKSFLGI